MEQKLQYLKNSHIKNISRADIRHRISLLESLLYSMSEGFDQSKLLRWDFDQVREGIQQILHVSVICIRDIDL